ncbi:MAG: DUF6318 family protein [Georgenia sp.]
MSLGERRRHGVLACVAGVLAAGALTGCTGSNGVEPIPTPSTSRPDATAEPTDGPTETATPEPPEVVKPTPSDAMRRDDVAGAEAAAVYFTELYPYVYATGDLTEWKAMSHPECIFCTSVIDNVGELVAAGEHLEGGEIDILEVTGNDPAPGYEFFQVNIGISQQPTIAVGEAGRRPESAGGTTMLKLAVGRVSDQWIVREGETGDYVGGE